MWILRTGVLSSSGSTATTIPINTTGLIMYVDSSISASYSGSGTTWVDLTSSAYNGTLINGVTYSASNEGQLVLDGVNDYIDAATNFAPGTSDFSIGVWVKLSSLQATSTGFFGRFRNGSRVGRIGVYYSTALTKARSIIECTGGTSIVSSTTSVNTDNWYYVVQTVNRSGNNTIYINGVAEGSQSVSAYAGQNVTWVTPMRFGTYPNASDVPADFMNGSVANGHIYTRELSAAEVLANFNATKAKYIGIQAVYAVYKAESNANDSLGVYNGTANGGLTYTTGISGNAFTGNGTNGFVSMPNNSFNFAGDFSISTWIYLTNTGSNQDLFSNADLVSGVDKGYRVQFRGLTNNIRVSIYGASAVTLDTGNIISTNTWYNVVVTRKAGSRTRIYVNGTLSTSNASTVNPVYTGTFTPCIGAYKSVTTPSTLNYLTSGSKIDEVVVWDSELTQAEVTELQTKYYPF